MNNEEFTFFNYSLFIIHYSLFIIHFSLALYNRFKVGIDIRALLKVPKCEATQAIVIIPIIEQFIDVLLSCLVLTHLCIV